MLLQREVNSARYSAQIVNPVLLPFLRQEGDDPFQKGNARPHTAAARQHALRDAQQLPGQGNFPDLSPTVYVWDTLSLEPATTIAEL